MLKYIISLAILVAHLSSAQEMEGYDQEVVSNWSSGPFLNDLNQQCIEDCNKTCVRPCPEAVLCKSDEIQCGKEERPADVWPDCIQDDKCVPDDCECRTEGKDGSPCPLWCETYCSDTEIKCPGDKDSNDCKERDVCIDRQIGTDNQLCPGYCPVQCDVQHELICPSPPKDGCPQAPICEQKAVDHEGNYCDIQQCTLTCEESHQFCAGAQLVDGCYLEDTCVPKGKNTDGDAYCDGNCPAKCDPTLEKKCDGTIIFIGPKAGCFNSDTCTDKARDVNGEFCPDESDSHGCPVVCPEGTHKCPTRTGSDNCKEQQTCTTCSKDNNEECCPAASDCPALCQPHEVECQTPGKDENGCPNPPICVVQERDYYGKLCTVHCPGVCNDNQILCPGGRDEDGCKESPFCEPLAVKLWGDDKGEYCPGFCPADCKDWEQLCSSVQDPCDGCPTEPECKPKAKDINGINCPPESASHGCAISCKTLDGLETICAAYDDPTAPGCQDKLTCLARSTGNNGDLCPSHSVCPRQCAGDEKQCSQGYDGNDCKKEDLCVPVPRDQHAQPCMNFECPPACDEEVEKYCQGSYAYNDQGQLCPLRDYCVDRPLDNNSLRCPGHCIPECGEGFEPTAQAGTDPRGCPLGSVCQAIAV